MIRKILISTDFSNLSRMTLGYVAAFARKVGADVIGTHAVTLPGPIYSHFEEAGQRFEELEAVLEQRLAQFFQHPALKGLRIKTRLGMGVPEEAVNNLASSEHVDLSVVAKHSRTGMERFFVGSVAEAIIRDSRVPVLVVPGAGSSTVSWKPVVCAVDFSATSIAALNFATRLTGLFGADLIVIHVVEVNPIHVLTDVKFKHFTASLMREAEARLSELVLTSGVPEGTRVVVEKGKPHQHVEELVRKTGSDLLIVGARGVHAAQNRGIGSTANAFIRATSVPAIVVP
jgi:nucleotide-binding universal stress UspA family protein